MGKRSRSRLGETSLPQMPSTAKASSPEPGAVREGPPPPPWGSLPLTEISVALGLVMLIAGFAIGGPTGTIVLVAGLVLGSLAGFEQALREHRSGYRPHSAVLAGIPAAALVGVMAAAGVKPVYFAPAAVGVALAAWLPIRASFTKRGD